MAKAKLVEAEGVSVKEMDNNAVAKAMWSVFGKHPGLLDRTYDPFAHIIDTKMPSVNWIFGRTHGLPNACSMVIYGLQKAGKSLIANEFIAQLHKTDPKAWVLRYDSEFRAGLFYTSPLNKINGIDMERVVLLDGSNPVELFDSIEKDLATAQQLTNNCVKLVIIDSINAIQGRRGLDQESIEGQQMGDEALTITTGLKRITPVLKRYKVPLIVCAHVRAEMDQQKVKQTHSQIRLPLPHSAKHMFEYFVYVDECPGGKDKGAQIFSTSKTDMWGNPLQTGHKIRVKMAECSTGADGRTGIITLDYKKGICNLGEETAMLGVVTGVVNRPNNVMYEYGGFSWKGRDNFSEAIETDTALREQMIKEIKLTDA